MSIDKDKIQKYQIGQEANIRQTAKKLDLGGIGFIVIINNKHKVIGIVTDGDFRRAILMGVNLDSNVLELVNNNFSYLEDSYLIEEVTNLFLEKSIFRIPVLKDGVLIDILFRENFDIAKKHVKIENKRQIDVVIMAGGKGTRMKPFTKILPKPLIPIGEKSMLEVIMDEYNLYFDSDFYISVNYKANIIKAYLEEFKNKYEMSYINEENPLGTGGALKYVENKIKKPFFVSNCDILIKADYERIYQSHIKNKYDITIVASMMHYEIPYGVCEINEGGELKKMVEKPEYDFLVNAGMYIINPDALKYIPKNQFYNITNLIDKVKNENGKVGVFPVTEKSYLDVGQWKEYNNIINTSFWKC